MDEQEFLFGRSRMSKMTEERSVCLGRDDERVK